MHAHDLAESALESKSHKAAARKFWFAVYEDVFDHPIVGMHVQPPAAADPTRKALFPFMIWLWMVKEAAHSERTIVVKDQYIDLARGQLVVAQRYLAEKANWTRKAARIFLDRLQRHGMVRLSSIARGGQMLLDFGSSKRGPHRGPSITIVTLCNYNTYQHRRTPKGPASGPARGPTGARIPTSTHLTSHKSHQSPLEYVAREDQSSDCGTDGTDGTDLGSNVVRLPTKGMVMDAPGTEFVLSASCRKKIEALGCDPEELVDRMCEQIDKGRRIGSKSRYLITSAINDVHEKTGTPKSVLKDLISGNRFAQQAAMVAATIEKADPSQEERTRRSRMSAPKTNGSALLTALKR